MKWTKWLLEVSLLLALLLPTAFRIDAAATQIAPIPLYHSPAAPSNLTITAVTGNQALLAWADNSDNETAFLIEKLNSDGVTFSQIGGPLPANSKSGLAYGFVLSTKYLLRVVAIAPAAVGLYEVPSDPIEVTTNAWEGSLIDRPGPGGGGTDVISGVNGLVGGFGIGFGGELKTPDGVLSLIFPERITVWDAEGKPASEYGRIRFGLSASLLSKTPPAPPRGAVIKAYELGPQGVIFLPSGVQNYQGSPASIRMTYSNTQIPEGMSEASLYSGVWDGAGWVRLPPSTIDTGAKTVTAELARSGTYALLAAAQTATALYHPPMAPTIISASPLNGYQAMVHWVDNSDNETVFRIERENGSGSWFQIGLLAGANETVGLVYPLSPNMEQTLRVVAIAPALIGLYESPSAPIKITTDNSEPINSPPGGPIGAGELGLRCIGFNHDMGMNTGGTLLDVDPEIKSVDGILTLSFPRFIAVRHEGIGILTKISISPVAISMPPPPQGELIEAYEFGPVGVIFVPRSAATEGYPNTHVTLTMSYSDAQIPAGTPETSFYIGIWDDAQWVRLPTSAPDNASNTVIARIAHTGTYGLLAETQPPPTTTSPPQTTITQTGPSIPPREITPPPPFSPPPAPPFIETTAFKVLLIASALLIAFGVFFYFRRRRENAGNHGEKDA